MMDDFNTRYRAAVEKETDIRDTSFLPEIPWSVCGFRLRWITALDYKILCDSGNQIIVGDENPHPAHVAAFYWFLLADKKPRAWWKLALYRWKFTKKIAVMSDAELVTAARDYLADNMQDAPGRSGDAFEPLPASWLVILCDLIAKEYGWDDDVIVRKPMARLYQYLNRIMQRIDPNAPRFNPSDSVKNDLLR